MKSLPPPDMRVPPPPPPDEVEDDEDELAEVLDDVLAVLVREVVVDANLFVAPRNELEPLVLVPEEDEPELVPELDDDVSDEEDELPLLLPPPLDVTTVI